MLTARNRLLAPIRSIPAILGRAEWVWDLMGTLVRDLVPHKQINCNQSRI